MIDADIISAVRKIRQLVTTLDSIGFPVHELSEDEDLTRVVNKKKIEKRITDLSSDIHLLLQRVEASKKYKDAVANLCRVDRDG